ncbi:MAG: inorganic diphosphatase [Candidatus Brocadia sp. AMX2]|uniref:Inorganic pyrophosphatase n=1 Tax=Candidatus Brocadia sinica JPN1 TaxID=1197129 RepID=A0ABQ0JV81_9BACT|nr:MULTISPECIES: inorganic diphosphatase [Brocadia]MBC6930980.1 inorganic diphosphatase [Candidatus Brocadia sp.]MBL1167970.1 inorganic diphosphatase [Candidatus Brocadia sp. AMX1]NOG41469.1 inorganic diphosphatase [Planctomycetota bacterium]GIK13805.1 MAG: inorganic pyrophosphatase [Candidatus Brocadia sinica]KAA0245311.1 MAG: inorganic diphosphatase [Candidatus Brocadia sp. AMX2]
MNLEKIPTGFRPPWDVNVIIEIPLGSEPVKYEVDPDSGAIFVDRFLHTAMFYPCNYGFIPHTLADDGDPVDVLVIAPVRVIPGSVIRCRPIGMLVMRDEEGRDEKVLAVPVDKLHPFYKDVSSYKQLPAILLDQIVHFFKHYKDLEPGKWVELENWHDADEAASYLSTTIERAASQKT